MNVRELLYMKNVWRLHGDLWANDAHSRGYVRKASTSARNTCHAGSVAVSR
jgi:hypothetical protein